jgi:hypothetical protein
MNKAVVQICALCWLFLLRLIMHGTNIKLYTCVLHILINVNYAEVNVYRTMFLQTLTMTDTAVRTPVRKRQGINCMFLEKRGCYEHVLPQVLNILNNDITPTAYLHSESAAKFETQYLHKQARRRYLGDGLNQACQTCGPLQAHLRPAQRIL